MRPPRTPDRAAPVGQPVTLVGTFADPDAGDAHTFRWHVVSQNGQVVAAGTSAAFTFTPSAPGTYTVTFTVTDAAGAANSDTTVVTVTGGNHAPVITSFTRSADCCGEVGENEWVMVTARFTDADIGDAHAAVIDSGDGTTSPATVNESSGEVTGAHRYTTGGVYRVTIRLTDLAAASDTSGATAYVTGAGVRDGVLRIVGTCRDDHVTVHKYGQISLKVHADFFGSEDFRTYSLAGIRRIEVYTCDGNDLVSISGQIGLAALLDGGAGDDHLSGGGGSEILRGGAGNDMLVGGAGRDLMIGGFGADRLVGNADEDVLIGGVTDHDSDPADRRTRRLGGERKSARPDFGPSVGGLRGAPGGRRHCSRRRRG